MKTTKIVKKWGDSMIIVVSPEELKMLKIKEGDVIEIDIEKVIK